MASTSAKGCCRPFALMSTARGCTTFKRSAVVALIEPWWPAFSTSARSSAGRVIIHQPSSASSASPGNSIANVPCVKRTPSEQLLIASPPAVVSRVRQPGGWRENPERDGTAARHQRDRAHPGIGGDDGDMLGADGLQEREVGLRRSWRSTVDEGAYGNLGDHPGHAAVVVGVGVRQNQGGEGIDAKLVQTREHCGTVIAGVDQDMARPASRPNR